MIDWLLQLQLCIAFGAAGMNLFLGIVLKRLPSLVSIGAVALVLLGIVAQTITSVVLLIQGQTPRANVFEFLGYLLTALLLPALAIFWSLAERTKYSTIVLGVAPLAIAVMLVRMSTLWTS